MSQTYLGKLGKAPCVMPIGPVAYWWDTPEYKHWNTAEHWHYVAWRDRVCDALVEAGYLVYRHWEAFKGTWNDDFQEINNIVLDKANFIVNMKPDYAWSEGTEEELRRCAASGKLVLSYPPPTTKEEFSWRIKEMLDELRRNLD